MKKLLLILVAFVCCLSLFTQNALLIYRQNYAKPLLVALKDITNITYKDAEQVMTLEQWNITSESETTVIDSLVFVDLETLDTNEYAHFVCPDDHHPHMIDLGLPSGVLWSCCNVDASAPEEYGGYYAWGETEEKEVYNWSTYTHGDGSAETFHNIGDDIAGTEYDVAHVKWGGLWNMPSLEQFRELEVNCTISWTSQNGVNGLSVTGPNGNRIFFPAGGDRREDNHNYEGSRGVYWTSTYIPNHSAYYYIMTNGDMYNDKGICSRGYTIRPVVSPPKTKDDCPVAEAIDLGLPSGTLWASWNVGASAPEEYGGYYAWGETEEKEIYTWNTYIHCDGTEETCRFIGYDIAGTEYDVAYVKWGGSWTMPSLGQINELLNNCTWIGTNQNGVNGQLVTGPNGATIFLPTAGVSFDFGYIGSYGGYWSSSLYANIEYQYLAILLQFNSNDKSWYAKDRCFGQPVRAVITPEKSKDDCPVAEAIDLGLPSGTKWASWNIGASAPEEYGGYYSWGETEEKDYYDVGTYKYYNSETNEYIHIGDDIAGTEYDVAHLKWGGSWRMPTKAQQDELLENCTREWTQLNGVNGMLVTGPNGNTIFLPAAGYHLDYNLIDESAYGRFWSSSLSPDREGNTYVLDFGSFYWNWYDSYYSYYGFSVRAVCPSSPLSSSYITFTDAAVKAICVANWDTDGDGELSYEEAAAVKSLGMVFYEKQGISSFNELQYFTGLTIIEEEAFRECSLESVSIPASVKTIGEKAFMQCPNLSNVTLPEGVTWIDEEAFSACALTSIILPESLVRLGEQALEENPLISVTLPRNVAYLGNSDEDDLYDGVFDFCYSLKEVNVDESNETYASIDGVLTTKDKKILLFYPYAKGDGYEVPEGIEQIHYKAFNECKNTSVTLPSTLKSFYTDEDEESYSSFSDNFDLRTVRAKMKVPFECGYYSFSSETYSSGTLYVPQGSKTLYETTTGWSRFQNIIEDENDCPVAEAIDLGLPSGTKWASWNVGASAPEEYGGYYAWGETEEKDYYSESTYKYYNSETKEYIHIGNDIAGTEYDVAYVKWGGSWRMPSVNQIRELLENCTRTWTQQNDVNGIMVTGLNGDSIFLPAAGYRWDDGLIDEDSYGGFWSSSYYYYNHLAYDVDFDSRYWYDGYFSRYYGLSVRAVCP